MIYIMNIIMANDHLLPCLIKQLTAYIIILIALTTTIIITVSKGVDQIWAIFKVTRQIQEAKITIRKWIKFRDKSENLFNANTIRKTINKRSRY